MISKADYLIKARGLEDPLTSDTMSTEPYGYAETTISTSTIPLMTRETKSDLEYVFEEISEARTRIHDFISKEHPLSEVLDSTTINEMILGLEVDILNLKKKFSIAELDIVKYQEEKYERKLKDSATREADLPF